MPQVSSTAVRDALAARRSVDGLVPRTVLDYIRERGLYQSSIPSSQSSQSSG